MKRTHSFSSSSSSTSCTESLGSSCPSPPPPSLPPLPQPPANKPKRRIRTKTNPLDTLLPPSTTQTPPSRRSSIYRGVTRHKLTGRFEAHLWDKNTWNTAQNKKGRQIYLGAYDTEEAAARTYDLAALKYWGPTSTTILNFPVENYQTEIGEMEKMCKDEYLASLRRKSSGFSRGLSKFRGVARHHHNGRWEARIGRVNGSKYLYLGTFSSQEEAAEAYDLAAIEHKGPNAITNFNISRYADKLQQKNLLLSSSSTDILQADETEHHQQQQNAETVDTPQLMDEEIELYPQQNAETVDTPQLMDYEAELYPQQNAETVETPQLMHYEVELYPQQQNAETVDTPQLMNEEVELYGQQNAETYDSPEVMYEELQLQPIVMPERCCDHEHEHIWNFCMENRSIEFDSLPVSVSDNVPYDKPIELPDLFVDTTFEDDIGFIFDYEAYDKDINQGDLLRLRLS